MVFKVFFITTKLFNCTKYIFEYPMKLYSVKANVKRIRIQAYPIAVSRRLGPSKVETTLNIYIYLQIVI